VIRAMAGPRLGDNFHREVQEPLAGMDPVGTQKILQSQTGDIPCLSVVRWGRPWH